MFDFVLWLLLLVGGFLFGRYFSKKIDMRLDSDEVLLSDICLSTERKIALMDANSATLVSGSAVLAQDYFMKTISIVQNLFGRPLSLYEKLLWRTRRLAVVRLKQTVKDLGYTHVFGIRFETVDIGKGVEVFAYGTAVRL